MYEAHNLLLGWWEFHWMYTLKIYKYLQYFFPEGGWSDCYERVNSRLRDNRHE